MTRRERMERRLENRREWAESRRRKAQAASNRGHDISQRFEFGQPILVGHHSERKARRDQARMDNCMRQTCEHADAAKAHDAKAANIEDALERTVFSDDEDAVARLEARIAGREQEAEHCKFVNARFKAVRHTLAKGGGKSDEAAALAELVRLGNIAEAEGMQIARMMALCPYERAPYPGHHLTNLRASIRRDQQRVEEIKRRAAATERAEAAGGVEVKPVGDGAVLVTFAEKPEREVLDALKAAGFYWSRGSWYGRMDRLPACVAGEGGA